MTTNNNQWRNLDDLPAGERVELLQQMVDYLAAEARKVQEAKPKRRVEDLTLKECNQVFDRISEIVGVKNVQNAVILPPLTTAQHDQMLAEVMAQTEAVLK